MTPLAEVVANWSRSTSEALVLRCGPAGGGEALVRWLTDLLTEADRCVPARSVPHPGHVPTVHDRTGDPGRAISLRSYRTGGRHVVLVGHDIRPEVPDRTSVDLVDMDGLDLTAAMSLMLQREGVSAAVANDLAALWSPATRLVDDIAAVRPAESELSTFVRQSSTITRLWAEQILPIPELLSLGRVLLLLRPREILVSDEWPQLANALSGGTSTLADVSRALLGFPWLFGVEDRDGQRFVRPKSPLAATLLEGFVPISGSEHYALYLALRERALQSLIRRDSSDEFVTQQLPRQAMASFSFEDLFQDAMAVLCSDTTALVREIERSPSLVLNPGAKAVLLCAHQLQSGANSGSSLELSAMRVGLQQFSSVLSEALPDRPWSAQWTRAQPVNANRIILSSPAPALSIATSIRSGGRAAVGTSDGKVWVVHPYRRARCVWDRSATAGEVRSVGLHVDGSGDRAVVALATSDQRVVAVDVESGKELWADLETHLAPLSALAVHDDADRPLVATAGVDGLVRVSDLLTGEPHLDELVVHRNRRGVGSVEVRCLHFIEVDGSLALLFGAVDGRIGLIDLTTGVTSTTEVTTSVLNSLRAVVEEGVIQVVVGTTDGEVLAVRLEQVDGLRHVDGGVVGRHLDSINSVWIDRNGSDTEVYAAASDRTWSVRPVEADEDAITKRIEGHFGPVNGIAVVRSDGIPLVLTAGGDGSCRVWVRDAVMQESLSLERPTRHAGPVTAIAFREEEGDVLVWTGGSDGEVRAWSANDSSSGRALTHDQVGITALALGVADADGRRPLYSGTARGELYRVDSRSGHSRRRVLLGIAHDGITALRMVPGRERPLLVSGGRDGAIMTWDTTTDEPVGVRTISQYGEITALCVTETGDDEATIVVGSQDGAVSFRAVDDLAELWSHGFSLPVNDLAPLPFHRAGLVAGLANGEVHYVRNARRGAEGWTLLGSHDADVTGVASFVVGGRLVVASAGLDHRLRLWDLSTRLVLQEIMLDGRALAVAGVSPRVAVGTTAGASIFTFNQDPLVLASKAL